MSNMEEQKEHCPNIAQYIVPWAGKLYNYCEIHANAICEIGEIISSPIQVKKIITLEQCEGANDLEKYEKVIDMKNKKG